MMLALGIYFYEAALFHLITHAYFKALLFLYKQQVALKVATSSSRGIGLWNRGKKGQISKGASRVTDPEATV